MDVDNVSVQLNWEGRSHDQAYASATASQMRLLRDLYGIQCTLRENGGDEVQMEELYADADALNALAVKLGLGSGRELLARTSTSDRGVEWNEELREATLRLQPSVTARCPEGFPVRCASVSGAHESQRGACAKPRLEEMCRLPRSAAMFTDAIAGERPGSVSDAAYAADAARYAAKRGVVGVRDALGASGSALRDFADWGKNRLDAAKAAVDAGQRAWTGEEEVEEIEEEEAIQEIEEEEIEEEEIEEETGGGSSDRREELQAVENSGKADCLLEWKRRRSEWVQGAILQEFAGSSSSHNGFLESGQVMAAEESEGPSTCSAKAPPSLAPFQRMAAWIMKQAPAERGTGSELLIIAGTGAGKSFAWTAAARELWRESMSEPLRARAASSSVAAPQASPASSINTNADAHYSESSAPPTLTSDVDDFNVNDINSSDSTSAPPSSPTRSAVSDSTTTPHSSWAASAHGDDDKRNSSNCSGIVVIALNQAFVNTQYDELMESPAWDWGEFDFAETAAKVVKSKTWRPIRFMSVIQAGNIIEKGEKERSLENQHIIIDEIHGMTNPPSGNWQGAIRRLAEWLHTRRYRTLIGLTATPYYGGTKDFCSILRYFTIDGSRVVTRETDDAPWVVTTVDAAAREYKVGFGDIVRYCEGERTVVRRVSGGVSPQQLRLRDTLNNRQFAWATREVLGLKTKDDSESGAAEDTSAATGGPSRQEDEGAQPQPESQPQSESQPQPRSTPICAKGETFALCAKDIDIMFPPVGDGVEEMVANAADAAKHRDANVTSEYIRQVKADAALKFLSASVARATVDTMRSLLAEEGRSAGVALGKTVVAEELSRAAGMAAGSTAMDGVLWSVDQVTSAADAALDSASATTATRSSVREALRAIAGDVKARDGYFFRESGGRQQSLPTGAHQLGKRYAAKRRTPREAANAAALSVLPWMRLSEDGAGFAGPVPPASGGAGRKPKNAPPRKGRRKGCDDSTTTCDVGKILNPATCNCVSEKGKRGRELLRNLNPQSNPNAAAAHDDSTSSFSVAASGDDDGESSNSESKSSNSASNSASKSSNSASNSESKSSNFESKSSNSKSKSSNSKSKKRTSKKSKARKVEDVTMQDVHEATRAAGFAAFAAQGRLDDPSSFDVRVALAFDEAWGVGDALFAACPHLCGSASTGTFSAALSAAQAAGYLAGSQGLSSGVAGNDGAARSAAAVCLRTVGDCVPIDTLDPIARALVFRAAAASAAAVLGRAAYQLNAWRSCGLDASGVRETPPRASQRLTDALIERGAQVLYYSTDRDYDAFPRVEVWPAAGTSAMADVSVAGKDAAANPKDYDLTNTKKRPSISWYISGGGQTYGGSLYQYHRAKPIAEALAQKLAIGWRLRVACARAIDAGGAARFLRVAAYRRRGDGAPGAPTAPGERDRVALALTEAMRAAWGDERAVAYWPASSDTPNEFIAISVGPVVAATNPSEAGSAGDDFLELDVGEDYVVRHVSGGGESEAGEGADNDATSTGTRSAEDDSLGSRRRMGRGVRWSERHWAPVQELAQGALDVGRRRTMVMVDTKPQVSAFVKSLSSTTIGNELLVKEGGAFSTMLDTASDGDRAVEELNDNINHTNNTLRVVETSAAGASAERIVTIKSGWYVDAEALGAGLQVALNRVDDDKGRTNSKAKRSGRRVTYSVAVSANRLRLECSFDTESGGSVTFDLRPSVKSNAHAALGLGEREHVFSPTLPLSSERDVDLNLDTHRAILIVADAEKYGTGKSFKGVQEFHRMVAPTLKDETQVRGRVRRRCGHKMYGSTDDWFVREHVWAPRAAAAQRGGKPMLGCEGEMQGLVNRQRAFDNAIHGALFRASYGFTALRANRAPLHLDEPELVGGLSGVVDDLSKASAGYAEITTTTTLGTRLVRNIGRGVAAAQRAYRSWSALDRLRISLPTAGRKVQERVACDIFNGGAGVLRGRGTVGAAIRKHARRAGASDGVAWYLSRRAERGGQWVVRALQVGNVGSTEVEMDASASDLPRGIALYLVPREMSALVTTDEGVACTGEGADAVFGGLAREFAETTLLVEIPIQPPKLLQLPKRALDGGGRRSEGEELPRALTLRDALRNAQRELVGSRELHPALEEWDLYERTAQQDPNAMPVAKDAPLDSLRYEAGYVLIPPDFAPLHLYSSHEDRRLGVVRAAEEILGDVVKSN